MVASPVRFVPLGGLGEIGMNCMAIEVEGRIVVIDCGVVFDQRGLGVDVVHADWEWLVDRQEDVEALILTHGHEDHIGAVSYFLRDFDVPVYGPAYALALVKNRIAEHAWHRARRIDYRLLTPGSRIDAAGMIFHPWQVTHSMPSCFGLVIETPQGIVIHTGDFKIDDVPPPGDRFDRDALAPFVERGIRMVLSDSTNALTEGRSGRELEVGEALEDVVSAARGRVVVGLFASNVHRMRMLFDIARRTERKVVPLGRSIDTHLRIAEELGMLPDPHDVLVTREAGRTLPPGRTLALATGSQGEPQAALARLASGSHPDMVIGEGDLVVLSSRVIPGNERPILDLVETFERRGIRVLSRSLDPRIHVSGHAHREEQRSILEWLRPRAFLPVHGTFVHLRAHADIARQAGVPEVVVALNGDVVELSERGLRIAERVWSGRIHIDRGGEPVDGRVLADRRSVAEWGEAVVSVVVDRVGRLVGEPRLTTRGVVVEAEEPELLEDAALAVARELEELRSPRLVMDDETLEDAARRALRRFFHAELGKKPLVSVLVHRLREAS
ncbi:MAG: ribonuclease J [Sandaracinaceae bacterium]